MALRPKNRLAVMRENVTMSETALDNGGFAENGLRVIFRDGGMVPKRLIGGLLDRFFPKLTKAFRKFLDAHGKETITSFTVNRTPLDKTTNTFANLLSAGDWEGIKQRGGVDKLFHTYAIINNKYVYEKLQTPTLKVASAGDLTREGAETVTVPVRSITISDFIENAIKKMGDKYYSYDAFTNNCQVFLLESLRGSNMLTEQARKFLQQELKKLAEEAPSFSKWIARKIIGVANDAERIRSEIQDKRGGRRHRQKVMMGCVH